MILEYLAVDQPTATVIAGICTGAAGVVSAAVAVAALFAVRKNTDKALTQAAVEENRKRDHDLHKAELDRLWTSKIETYEQVLRYASRMRDAALRRDRLSLQVVDAELWAVVQTYGTDELRDRLSDLDNRVKEAASVDWPGIDRALDRFRTPLSASGPWPGLGRSGWREAHRAVLAYLSLVDAAAEERERDRLRVPDEELMEQARRLGTTEIARLLTELRSAIQRDGDTADLGQFGNLSYAVIKQIRAEVQPDQRLRTYESAPAR